MNDENPFETPPQSPKMLSTGGFMLPRESVDVSESYELRSDEFSVEMIASPRHKTLDDAEADADELQDEKDIVGSLAAFRAEDERDRHCWWVAKVLREHKETFEVEWYCKRNRQWVPEGLPPYRIEKCTLLYGNLPDEGPTRILEQELDEMLQKSLQQYKK